MSEVAKFEHSQFGELRTVDIDGETWFVANDVSGSLGYSDPARAVKKHVDSEDKQEVSREGRGVRNGPPVDLGEHFAAGVNSVVVINESGLYALIFGSRLESAKAFKRWVTSEVLPTIRKTGSYNLVNTPHSFADALELAAKQQREIETMAPRVELLELFEDKREGFSVADAGALFGYKAFQFHEIMRTWGATYRNESGNTVASKFWVDKGWLKKRNAVTPAVTPMGLAEIERRLGRKAVG